MAKESGRRLAISDLGNGRSFLFYIGQIRANLVLKTMSTRGYQEVRAQMT